ncbi:hypothetical protein GCM10009828_079110 [Actinoplanes couchii]|uniref:Uncharacterized protein n=1 Tax=Actinoplanes couchii TaxID=403638 RepID=A0ABQ3XFP5_9ACTN|nr:hypothetical protein Aco03nite_056920 [Actinoplanes couchii]
MQDPGLPAVPGEAVDRNHAASQPAPLRGHIGPGSDLSKASRTLVLALGPGRWIPRGYGVVQPAPDGIRVEATYNTGMRPPPG